MKKLILPFVFLLVLFSGQSTFSAIDTLTIAEAIEDLDMDTVPDRLNDTVCVSGVVISPNFQTTNNSFYLYDWTAGTDIFMFGPPVFNWALGDSLKITGTVAQFNGVTEIIPLDSASWDSVGSGGILPDPIALTLAQYKANPEMYEGSLLWFGGLSKVGMTWPTSGDATIMLSDGTDTIDVFIRGATDIPGQTEPLYPVDLVGIGGQFDNSDPYDEGYEILPRYYTDFTPSPFLTIAQAIEDLDMDTVPDRLGDTVIVYGVVISPNFQTTNNSFYLYDWTAGTDIFMFGPPVFNWALGDSLKITGTVAQFNGVTEIISLDSASWDSVGSGGVVPDPTLLTLAEYKANPEMYEGSLVAFRNLSLVGGTWPASGSTNLSLSDGVDTVEFRIDSDTDIDGQTEPTWPQDVIGIGSQFDNSDPYDEGYQVFPRYYTDFLAGGTIPVELTSFSAISQKGGILLRWATATELNNSGFDIERRQANKEWSKIAFLAGFGTTTSQKEYSYVDQNLASGTYQYRLKQIDLDGSYKYSNIIETNYTVVSKFELAQNYPNPFNPSTTIKFSLPAASNVTLKIYNTLGQEVKTLINGFIQEGSHTINLDAKDLSSGLYFYKLDAGSLSQVRKMMLLK